VLVSLASIEANILGEQYLESAFWVTGDVECSSLQAHQLLSFGLLPHGQLWTTTTSLQNLMLWYICESCSEGLLDNVIRKMFNYLKLCCSYSNTVYILAWLFCDSLFIWIGWMCVAYMFLYQDVDKTAVNASLHLSFCSTLHSVSTVQKPTQCSSQNHHWPQQGTDVWTSTVSRVYRCAQVLELVEHEYVIVLSLWLSLYIKRGKVSVRTFERP